MLFSSVRRSVSISQLLLLLCWAIFLLSNRNHDDDCHHYGCYDFVVVVVDALQSIHFSGVNGGGSRRSSSNRSRSTIQRFESSSKTIPCRIVQQAVNTPFQRKQQHQQHPAPTVSSSSSTTLLLASTTTSAAAAEEETTIPIPPSTSMATITTSTKNNKLLFTSDGHEVPPPAQKAYVEQPPHSGCHFRPTHPGTSITQNGPKHYQRFFEGWYYRVTIPPNQRKGSNTATTDNDGVSFAFIVSIEDPFHAKGGTDSSRSTSSPLSLACHQIMGPNDEYLVQSDKDHTKFWAWDNQQALGCVFDYNDDNGRNSNSNSPDSINSDRTKMTVIDPDRWDGTVQSGFQILPNRLQGKLLGHDGSLGGVGPNQGIPGICQYDISITPLAGWGDETAGQKSTAGWLASYKVFEPHWQVTMADGRASGTVLWKGIEYSFVDAPFYAEKNWGGAFPIRWYWCQCNSFDGYYEGVKKDNHLSVTAGGGTRKILLGQKESLGMVTVHHNGIMYEATPWLGDMTWSISPWGSWIMSGRCTGGPRPFEVVLEARCDSPGVVLRAPTEKDGMEYFCRDSFFADVTLSLWELEKVVVDDDGDDNDGRWWWRLWKRPSKASSFRRGKVIIENARSSQGAVEIGGGPWWYNWTAKSKMKQPMKGMVRLPYRLQNLRKRIFGRKR
jgi:tocopherol cyclase